MYARVTTSKVEAAKIDDWTKHYKEKTYPDVKEMKGFKGITLLANRDTNSVMTVAVWDTEDDMKAQKPVVIFLK